MTSVVELSSIQPVGIKKNIVNVHFGVLSQKTYIDLW